ncbi:hypothetical protein LCGC14_2391810, partial [marine sediment metagenome]
MWKRLRPLAGAADVLRPVCLSVIAMLVAAVAMAFAGSRPGRVVAGVGIALIAVAMVLQIRWAVRHLRRQSDMAHEARLDAEQHYAEVLYRIINFVEARDEYWRGHSENVARLVEKLARKLDFPARLCRLMHVAGRLHDIGMIAVPEELVKSRRNFGVDEYRIIKPHSQVSYEVLKPMTSLEDVLAAVRHHHERMNGTGYPDGLADQEIPLTARILAVADAYDAMTHDRPHRQAMTPLQAMQELRRCSPAGYDPVCVDALADVV